MNPAANRPHRRRDRRSNDTAGRVGEHPILPLLRGRLAKGVIRGGRIEPSCIDEAATADGGSARPADGQIETVIANPAGKHRSAEYDHRAGRFGLALKGEH
jgi:hypothetical protein